MTNLCLDGNTACAMIAYQLVDIVAIYPITPSSTMSEIVEAYAAQNKLNLFGNVVTVKQAQSELGAAAFVHGAIKSGSLTTTFTSSQGLLLMIPNLYFLGASHCPAVIHLANRTVGMFSTTLSPDHSDIYAISNTQVAALCSRNVQEAHDMALVAHLSAIESMQTFVHFFEGFRVSHQFESFTPIDNELIKPLINHEKLRNWRETQIIDPNNPSGKGLGCGNEIYYQIYESNKQHFDEVPKHVSGVLKQVAKITNRHYEPFEYYGHKEAEKIIVAMGSQSLTIQQIIEKLADQNEKVGFINVRLWRPFDLKYFISKIPKTAKSIAVLDRARDLSSNGELLYKEVITCIFKADMIQQIHVVNCTFGIAGVELLPGDVFALIQKMNDKKVKQLRMSIKDDIYPETCLVPIKKSNLQLFDQSTKELIIYALGADGTIGAIRNAMKLLQDADPSIQLQANFEFDGKKSGGITISHLRFGREKINTQFNPEQADYVAVHTQSYLNTYQEIILNNLKQDGVLFLNADYENVETQLAPDVKRAIAKKGIKLYLIDAYKVAEQLGLRGRISMVTVMFLMKLGMQGLINLDNAAIGMKHLCKITFQKQAASVLEANYKIIDHVVNAIDQCQYTYNQQEWANIDNSIATKQEYGGLQLDANMQPGSVFDTILKRDFNNIKTSDVIKYQSGSFPNGYSKHEKPGVAARVASYDASNCVKCNLCSSACPHAVIRPQKQGDQFKIMISPLDCRGCQLCVGACPKKCITMMPVGQEVVKQKEFDDCFEKFQEVDLQKCSLVELQFANPYFFNPGSCPGCAETQVVRLVTTLFGEGLVVASAVGCCLVWGHYNPFRPYQVDAQGHGPAVATSAFEDNSMFGLGMVCSNITQRNNLKSTIKNGLEQVNNTELKQILEQWLKGFDDFQQTKKLNQQIIDLIKLEATELTQKILKYQMFLTKRTHWIIGGDGWSYDIDFGGLDHVMSSGANVNILIFNNNCYANTGGQYSKASFHGSSLKDATNGVEGVHKKMAEMFITYRSCYIAQIAFGANRAQSLNAIREAAQYNGVSLIIAYCPCIAHNISGGMANSEKQQQLAVQSGLWPLFRYYPETNKLKSDSKVTKKVTDFIDNEQRFQTIKNKNQEKYDQIVRKLQEDVDQNIEYLKKLE